MSAKSNPPPPSRIVRCADCGRTEPVSAMALTGYMQTGWPRCCGGVMTYFTAAEPLVEAGTRFSHKCPVCGREWAITLPPGVEVATAAPECVRCRGKQPAVPPT